LAILNSKLINYWFSFYYFDVNIKPEQLRTIPVKIPANSIQDKICSYVDNIIKDGDLSLTSKIDELIYNIYGLTEEEIKIVEGA